MRIIKSAALLGVLAAAVGGIALAADDYLAKGKKFTVLLNTVTEMSGMKSTTAMTNEYTITAVSDSEVSYDVHITGKGSAGGAMYDMPPTDMKDQKYNRPSEGAGSSSSGAGAGESDIDVDAGGAFQGKVHVLHNKTDNVESWASTKPIEIELKLGDGSKLKAHCSYAKSVSEQGGMRTTAETLVLVDFPIPAVYMHSTTEGNGTKSEMNSALQSIK
jgi:hypothetical protein